MSDFRFRALISVVFQPLCPACSLFLFRRINDDDESTVGLFKFIVLLVVAGFYRVLRRKLRKTKLNTAIL